MPKACITFNLPEEQDEHRLALDAGKYYSCLWELDNHLRGKVKYEADNLSEAQLEAYIEFRKMLHDFMEAAEVKL